ncbi:MAG: carboxymuconolactone decarboxylase family protein [Alphaproteobacteria bacterium]|nr:carboxymuconolactone decarboxylase family protein [Alphaproteobacteria bacterium]
MIERLNYLEINSKATNGLAAASKHLASIDSKLRAIVELRVSQINGCVYCVDLHATQARAAGETRQRLDCIAVWRECQFFDDRERAALAWAEAVTLLPDTNAPDKLYNRLKEHFSEQQIVDLTLIVSLMNAWNRLAVGFRHGPDARN